MVYAEKVHYIQIGKVTIRCGTFQWSSILVVQISISRAHVQYMRGHVCIEGLKLA